MLIRDKWFHFSNDSCDKVLRGKVLREQNSQTTRLMHELVACKFAFHFLLLLSLLQLTLNAKEQPTLYQCKFSAIYSPQNREDPLFRRPLFRHPITGIYRKG